jgi:hypothetical protein
MLMQSRGHRKAEIARELARRFPDEETGRPLSVEGLKVDLAPSRTRIWRPRLTKLLRMEGLVAYQFFLVDMLDAERDRAESPTERLRVLQAMERMLERAMRLGQVAGLFPCVGSDHRRPGRRSAHHASGRPGVTERPIGQGQGEESDDQSDVSKKRHSRPAAFARRPATRSARPLMGELAPEACWLREKLKRRHRRFYRLNAAA